jgi:hypothetical protein
MSLAEKLEAIRAGGAKRIPEEMRAVMGRATQDLRESGIMDGVPKPGDALPEFSLANADGAPVTSAQLLSQGAVVLTVFRGSW